VDRSLGIVRPRSPGRKSQSLSSFAPSEKLKADPQPAAPLSCEPGLIPFSPTILSGISPRPAPSPASLAWKIKGEPVPQVGMFLDYNLPVRRETARSQKGDFFKGNGGFAGSGNRNISLYGSIVATVLAGGKGERLRPLTESRAKAAVPFGGLCRLIDFALSNLVKSGVPEVHVIAEHKSRSLTTGLSAVDGGVRPWRTDLHTAGPVM
jgi:hypothetical protein